MTQCKQEKFAFEPVAGRRIEWRSDGTKLSSDGGLPLVREVASACRFFTRLKTCFIDTRNQDAITHSVESLIQQRTYGLLAEAHTLRVRLIKGAVQVSVSVRRIYLSFAQGLSVERHISVRLANVIGTLF